MNFVKLFQLADQTQTVFSVRMDRRAAYIAKPEDVGATVKEPGKKKVYWKKKLIIAAVVIALIVIVGVAILVILPHVDSDSLDFITNILEEEEEDQPCLNLPNGLINMTFGVNILEIDTDPRNNNVSGDGGTGQIIAITCNEGKKFVDQNGKEWDIPDQVTYIENLYIGQSSFSSSLFQTTEQLDAYRSERIKVDGFLARIAGQRRSVSWEYYSNKITQESKTIVKTSIFFGSYKIVFKSYEGLRFESSVMTSFKKLRDCSQNKDPGDLSDEERLLFEECKSAYKDFIDFHGTHYYTQASLGGRVWSYYEVPSTYARSKSESELKGSAKKSFSRLLGIENEITREDEDDIDEFEDQAEYEISYKGGKDEFKNGDNFQEWRESVLSYPDRYEFELAPIYFLIDVNDARREMMKIVLEEYIEERVNA